MVRTRLDKLVRIREREEDEALADLARAQSKLRAAHEKLASAVEAARADRRAPGDAALWDLEEAAHRRALQVVRHVQGEVAQATKGQNSAQGEYLSARQDAETVRRVAERKRGEIVQELDRKERRSVDEIATLRFNLKPAEPKARP
jgi:flagellar export protein FliJ